LQQPEWIVRRLMRVLLAVALLLACNSGSAQEAVIPHCPCTYTLTQEQRALLDSALSSATFWLSVRSAAVKNTLDEQAFEQLRRSYVTLANELARQDKAASEKRKREEQSRPKPTAPGPSQSLPVLPSLGPGSPQKSGPDHADPQRSEGCP
jgi:hypothetical protein